MDETARYSFSWIANCRRGGFFLGLGGAFLLLGGGSSGAGESTATALGSEAGGARRTGGEESARLRGAGLAKRRGDASRAERRAGESDESSPNETIPVRINSDPAQSTHRRQSDRPEEPGSIG